MPDLGREALLRATEVGQRHVDAAIRAVADAQFSVIALDQLRALGLSDSGVRARVRRGALARLYRGVYAVGHASLRRQGAFMAAALAYGDDAALSHASAGANLGIRPSAATRIDITVRRSGRRAQPRIRLHRSATLVPADVEDVDGIPTTTVARTLLDLAEVIDEQGLAKAFDRAESLRILGLHALDEVIARNPGRHGLRPLRALLASIDPLAKRTRSELEDPFLALCADHRLLSPRVNHRLELEGVRIEVDSRWPERRLVAETDGWETHGTGRAFERDRRRDQLLLRADHRAVRFSWRQVLRDPDWVAETIRRALAAI